MKSLFGFLRPLRAPRVTRPATKLASRRRQPYLEALEDRTVPSSSGIIDLGAAGQFSVLGINGGKVTLNSSHIVGNIGLGPNEASVLQKTEDSGTLLVDPTATPDLSNLGKDFLPSGGVITQDLSQAASDANSASAAYAALAPTQTFGSLTKSTTITGNGGTNVISLDALSYNSQTLTLQGGPNDVFIFNVAGGFTFADSKIVLSGGVTAGQVLFNFPSSGPEIDFYKATNVVNGIFLAPQRSINYHNPAAFHGAVIARDIYIHSNANLNTDTAALSGFVYQDTNNNGVKEAGEAGINGLLVTLTGTDNLGNSVTISQLTDANGFYSFRFLPTGTYTITETQPAGFDDGLDSIGTQGGSVANDWLFNIILEAGVNGINNNFGELVQSVPPNPK